MLIRKKLPRAHGVDEPMLHPDHSRPVTRREMIATGLITGPAVVAMSSMLGLFAPRRANALAQDLTDIKASPCGILKGAGRIPFICFDLAGGANLNGSEILIGGKGGQLDFLSTAGYGRLGLPGDMVPNAPNAASATNNFVDRSFGVAFHSDGAILRGMLERTAPTTQARVNGCAIAARSENDTGNNPHNPMYGILKTGSTGELLGLIGSQASDSGGNSMAPAAMLDLTNRPTKVDRASDVTGLVDTGQLATLLPASDAVHVLESMERISGGVAVAVQSQGRIGKITFGTDGRDAAVQNAARCAYVKTAYLADAFGNPATLNPDKDPNIVDQTSARGTGIFGQAEYTGDAEFRKTAAVMKMVIDGNAGAGTITMGGYDYHDGTRASGEQRNLRAGRCIGACLEYAARVGRPVMIYVFSDGSLSATNMVDSSANGRGKFGWQGDNQATACSFFLVFNPNVRPQAIVADASGSFGKQLGYFRADGSVETSSHPGANAVNLLVETVVLNYLALHGEENKFTALFPSQGLGGTTLRDSLMAFGKLA